jgi:hypothetical protein
MYSGRSNRPLNSLRTQSSFFDSVKRWPGRRRGETIADNRLRHRSATQIRSFEALQYLRKSSKTIGIQIP